MPFALDSNPTLSEISEAINYILANFGGGNTVDPVTGQIIAPGGVLTGYLYKYLAVKYADSSDGSVNFSNTPTGRLYFGLRNSDNPVESTNPADYIWYLVSGGFGSTKQFFYSVTGGRQIDFLAAISAPSALYQADTGASIDLDVISGSDGSSSRICYAKSTSTSLASTPTTYQTTGNSSFPPTNTWGGAETWQATPPVLAVNEALFQSDGIYNPTTNLTTWNVPYLSNLRVGSLSAISANLGSVTAGELVISGSGGTPTISGTTMTGAGTHLYDDGRFALGNASTNITFNGTTATLNGFTSGPQSSVSNVGPLDGSTLTFGSLTLSKPGFTGVSVDGYVSVQSSSISAFASWRYVDLLVLNIQLKNSSGTVIKTFTYNMSGACAITYTPPFVGPFYLNAFRNTFASFIPLNLPADTYSFVGNGDFTLTDASGNKVTATTSSGVTLNFSLFQVAA